jgi:glycosyltransferase involved in cell wall biosynthesis
MFSIFILTHNEELDIGPCIESVIHAAQQHSCPDITVVDSLSGDRTEQVVQHYIDQGHPVQWVPHRFESHGKQRTWMIRYTETRHPWVYILEADERFTPELFRECAQTSQTPEHVGYFVAERVMFMGKWIKHSTQYPRYQMRLFDKAKVWFTDYGHTEREVCEGSTGFLTETYPHFTSGKGFARWFDKHNIYSTNEAKETIRQLERPEAVNLRDLFFGDTEVDRRHALKNLSLRIPGRPLVRFLYMYFVLGGVLDGGSGFAWCTLQAFYEYMIVLKAWEMRQMPVPAFEMPRAVDEEMPIEKMPIENSPEKTPEKTPVGVSVTE